jgi:hypothetical protein
MTAAKSTWVAHRPVCVAMCCCCLSCWWSGVHQSHGGVSWIADAESSRVQGLSAHGVPCALSEQLLTNLCENKECSSQGTVRASRYDPTLWDDTLLMSVQDTVADQDWSRARRGTAVIWNDAAAVNPSMIWNAELLAA